MCVVTAQQHAGATKSARPRSGAVSDRTAGSSANDVSIAAPVPSTSSCRQNGLQDSGGQCQPDGLQDDQPCEAQPGCPCISTFSRQAAIYLVVRAVSVIMTAEPCGEGAEEGVSRQPRHVGAGARRQWFNSVAAHLALVDWSPG